MKAIFKNLRSESHDDPNARFMICLNCGSESSAHKSEYWYIGDPEFEFTCCNETMELATRQVIIEPIN